MSVRHQGDFFLNHPEFTASGDATSIGPSRDLFSSWLLDKTTGPSSNDTPSLFEHIGDAQTESLDAFDLTVDTFPFTLISCKLDGAADATNYFDDSTPDGGVDSATYNGSDGSTNIASGLNIQTNIEALFAPWHHQDASGDLNGAEGFGPTTDFTFDAFGSWGAPISDFAVLPPEPSLCRHSDPSGEITLLDMEYFAKGGNSGSAGGGGPGVGGALGGGGGNGGGDPGVLTEYFAGSENGDAGYDIWIEFKGDGWTTSFQDAFIQAANYFTTVITEDIGGGARYHGKIVDDLYVTAELTSIDGAGGILGQAGPTAVWSANELTAAGQMQFDVADAQFFFDQGLWNDIVTHEFMHVLGFGSLWNYGDDPLVSGDQYLGAFGVEAYQSVDSGASFIPVEEDGGAGTAGAHWDEQLLGNELMTGYINESNYLSEFSVVSLADLGYQIEYQSDGLLIA